MAVKEAVVLIVLAVGINDVEFRSSAPGPFTVVIVCLRLSAMVVGDCDTLVTELTGNVVDLSIVVGDTSLAVAVDIEVALLPMMADRVEFDVEARKILVVAFAVAVTVGEAFEIVGEETTVVEKVVLFLGVTVDVEVVVIDSGAF